jgi:hypothetical protein
MKYAGELCRRTRAVLGRRDRCRGNAGGVHHTAWLGAGCDYRENPRYAIRTCSTQRMSTRWARSCASEKATLQDWIERANAA